jgi:hypothetical protein
MNPFMTTKLREELRDTGMYNIICPNNWGQVIIDAGYGQLVSAITTIRLLFPQRGQETLIKMSVCSISARKPQSTWVCQCKKNIGPT